MIAQPCYLLMRGDDPANASFCDSISDAKDLFCSAHRRSTQTQYATLHFVEQQGDDFDPVKPDRWLRLSSTSLVTAGHPLT